MFKKAVRTRVPLKLAISGPPGSGKTFGALRMGTSLANGERLGVIDTENSSASLYAGQFEFEVENLHPPFSSEQFLETIRAANQEKFGCLIVDSFSHFWEGILDYKGGLDAKGGNPYTNWNQATRKFSPVL